jgi:hypothetical protein
VGERSGGLVRFDTMRALVGCILQDLLHARFEKLAALGVGFFVGFLPASPWRNMRTFYGSHY